jgi:ABC-type antimicrobial peptide transport system, ATPase component
LKVLDAKDIIKIYGGKKGISKTKAIDGISLSIEEGEFVAIMGPSGSGKTSLLNILSGIDKPTSGYVNLLGEEIINFNKDKMTKFRRERLGLIFQDFNLLEGLTVEENISLPLILQKAPIERINNKVTDLMKIFNIYDIKNKHPYNISGGQQQRTAACRALITNPAILLADEPTGNLDSKSSKRFMKYLELINSERKATILMVTHDSFAASFCSRIIFIKDGKIYSEIYRKEGQREFFNKILDCLAVLGGDINEL